MKKIILNLIILLSINLHSQTTLEKFEGIWVSKSTRFITVFTHNTDGDFLEIYTFSFMSNEPVEENITKIKKGVVYTKTKNYNSNWKVKTTYHITSADSMVAIFSGDIKTTVMYNKAKLHVEQ